MLWWVMKRSNKACGAESHEPVMLLITSVTQAFARILIELFTVVQKDRDTRFYVADVASSFLITITSSTSALTTSSFFGGT